MLNADQFFSFEGKMDINDLEKWLENEPKALPLYEEVLAVSLTKDSAATGFNPCKFLVSFLEEVLEYEWFYMLFAGLTQAPAHCKGEGKANALLVRDFLSRFPFIQKLVQITDDIPRRYYADHSPKSNWYVSLVLEFKGVMFESCRAERLLAVSCMRKKDALNRPDSRGKVWNLLYADNECNKGEKMGGAQALVHNSPLWKTFLDSLPDPVDSSNVCVKKEKKEKEKKKKNTKSKRKDK